MIKHLNMLDPTVLHSKSENAKRSDGGGDLNPDQLRAFELMQRGSNVFLTGAAGSGKSYVLKAFSSLHSLKEFPILSSTGASAVLLGGRTVHSFFGIGIVEGGVEKALLRASQDKKLQRRLKGIKGFVIDEISMISGEILFLIESICRRVLQKDQPWGGLQVIIVGDFCQLPPVSDRSFQKDWAFLNPCWQRSNFDLVSLKINQRSQHVEFLSILDRIRKAQIESDVLKFLQDRTKNIEESVECTRLFPVRKTVEAYNAFRLERIQQEKKTFPSVFWGSARGVEALKKTSPVVENLELKKSALVMIRTNDPRGRWVNGTLAHVLEIKSDELVLELFNKRVVSIEKSSFTLLDGEGEVLASVTNFPVSLAYASTIHKAQGMTLDRVHVDLCNLWEPGQAYVALSRVRNPVDLSLARWSKSSLRCDEAVKQFYQKIET